MSKERNREILFQQFAERIQPVYELLKWEWGMGRENNIPTVDDIVDTLKKLLEDYDDKLGGRHSTGGLYVDKAEDGIEYGFEDCNHAT